MFAATLTFHSLPKILDKVKEFAQSQKITKVIVDGFEIENPTPEIIEQLIRIKKYNGQERSSDIEEAEYLVSQNRTAEALESLTNTIKEKGIRDIHKDLVILQATYEGLTKDSLRGTLSMENYRVEITKINLAILDTIDKINIH